MGFSEMKEGTGPGIEHVFHLTPPPAYRNWNYEGTDSTDFCIAELELAIDRVGASNIAAMIAEPIMSVGGIVVPRADYWPRMHQLLEAYGILLIFDEAKGIA